MEVFEGDRPHVPTHRHRHLSSDLLAAYFESYSSCPKWAQALLEQGVRRLVLGVVQTLPCTKTPNQEGTHGGLASHWGCACQTCGPGPGAMSAKSKVHSEGSLFLISLPRGGAFGNSSALRGYIFSGSCKVTVYGGIRTWHTDGVELYTLNVG